MSDKYAALKQAAEKAQFESKDEWGYDTDAFHDEATPETILELLAERDADKRRIEELESQRRLAFMACNRWADKCREAEHRIAELEARTLTVKLPDGYAVRSGHPINEGERGVMIPKEGGEWLHRFDVEHALQVAGVSLKEKG